MEAFLRAWAPRHVAAGTSFDVKVFQGKPDLLSKLPARLRGYRPWLPADWRLVVLLDRDGDDCRELKARLEGMCRAAGMPTRAEGADPWAVATCLAIEELEAWYFGDWEAVRSAYPKLPASIPRQAKYRDPDAIVGGTAEALERILKRHGYALGGLAKRAAAREVGHHLDARRTTSASFRHLIEVLG